MYGCPYIVFRSLLPHSILSLGTTVLRLPPSIFQIAKMVVKTVTDNTEIIQDEIARFRCNVDFNMSIEEELEKFKHLLSNGGYWTSESPIVDAEREKECYIQFVGTLSPLARMLHTCLIARFAIEDEEGRYFRGPVGEAINKEINSILQVDDDKLRDILVEYYIKFARYKSQMERV